MMIAISGILSITIIAVALVASAAYIAVHKDKK